MWTSKQTDFQTCKSISFLLFSFMFMAYKKGSTKCPNFQCELIIRNVIQYHTIPGIWINRGAAPGTTKTKTLIKNNFKCIGNRTGKQNERDKEEAKACCYTKSVTEPKLNTKSEDEDYLHPISLTSAGYLYCISFSFKGRSSLNKSYIKKWKQNKNISNRI